MPKVKNTIQNEPKYPLAELLEKSEALFNCRKEVLLGSLAGINQDQFTVKEMYNLLKNFLQRRVF